MAANQMHTMKPGNLIALPYLIVLPKPTTNLRHTQALDNRIVPRSYCYRLLDD
jgi:hypothetical protein